jgi:hypothetical protein
MRLLRRLLGRGPGDPPALETQPVDLDEHDIHISELAEALQILEQIQPEPLTARVRGIYPRRTERPIHRLRRPRPEPQQ